MLRVAGFVATALLTAMLAIQTRAAESSTGIYVAPNGNDQWSGRLDAPNAAKTDGPLATLPAARDRLRQLKAAGKATGPGRIVLRGGVYRITSPVTLNHEDSGITLTSYPGEKATISGGRVISGWKKTSEGFYAAEIPDVKSGKWYFRALFVGGTRATPARTPNEDTFRAAGPGVQYKRTKEVRKDQKIKISLHYQNDDIRPWSNLADAVAVVYHSWTTSRHVIKRIDPQQKLVEFTAPSGWPFGWWEKNQRYYVEFVREALDAPGEWYLDRHTGVLTYCPRPGEDMSKVEVVAPVAEELLRLEGDPLQGKLVEKVRVVGITFAHTNWIMPKAEIVDGQANASLKTATVYAQGAKQCSFERCEIVHTGGYGLWLQYGCVDNVVRQCELHDLGAGGIRLGAVDLPAQETMQSRKNLVENCFIHDGGKVYHAGIGVWLGKTAYNTVRNCDICDFLYTGVSLGWSWGYAPSSANHNVIEFNHIHHLGWGQLSDLGGIYSLGMAPGSVLRNNLIHDVLAYSYGGWGLYTDEGSSDMVLENNIVYRVKDGAFHQHYGRENTVRNNILTSSATVGQIVRSREEEHSSFTLERNIVYGPGVPPLGKNWKNGQYKLRQNVYFTTDGPTKFPGDLSLADWQKKGHDAGSIVADPQFVDAARFDFRLQADSPALKLGFQPIDTNRIGLQGDKEWADLPKKVVRPKMKMPGEP